MTAYTMDVRELSLDEIESVGGGADALDAFLLGVGTGGLVGGLIGNAPGAAIGAAVGGVAAVIIFYI